MPLPALGDNTLGLTKAIGITGNGPLPMPHPAALVLLAPASWLRQLAGDKLAQIDRSSNTSTDLGMPIITSTGPAPPSE